MRQQVFVYECREEAGNPCRVTCPFLYVMRAARNLPGSFDSRADWRGLRVSNKILLESYGREGNIIGEAFPSEGKASNGGQSV